MCLAARRRIDILAKLDNLDAVNAMLNKLLSFHQTLSRYDINRFSQHSKFENACNFTL